MNLTNWQLVHDLTNYPSNADVYIEVNGVGPTPIGQVANELVAECVEDPWDSDSDAKVTVASAAGLLGGPFKIARVEVSERTGYEIVLVAA